MKLSARIWLAFLALIFDQAIEMRAADSSSAPATIVLNGLTSIFGDARIFLQVTSPGVPTENILLTEGQTVHGIKLLAVDVRAARVRIDNCGQIQTLKICNPPELGAAANVSAGDGGATIVHSPAESLAHSATGQVVGKELVQPDGQSGAVLIGGVKSNSKTTSTDNQTSPNDSSGSADSSGSVGSPDTQSPNTHIYYWWMEDAKKIEQSRLDTAQQVLAGELPAEPLTPLTPPGTPANLIGDYSVYVEHGRGMVVSN